MMTFPAGIEDSLSVLPPELRWSDLGDGLVLRHAYPPEYDEVGDVLESAFTTGCWVTPMYIGMLHKIAERSRTAHVWVVADAQGVVGAVLTPKPELHAGDRFTFNILGVGPRGRGKALGRRLTDHAVAVARHLGYRTVEIHSSPQMTAAHQVYYRYGFVRRIDWETVVVDSGQRLFTFTLRIPHPRTDIPAPRVEGVLVTTDPLRPDGIETDAGLFVPAPPARPGPVVVPSGARLRLEVSWDSPRSVPAILAARLSGATQVAVVSAAVGPRLYADDELLSDDWWEIPAALAGLTRDPAGLYVDGVSVDAVADQLWIDVVEGLEQAIFSSTTTAREAALRVFYARLGLIELRLATAPYLVGDHLTLADLILFGVVLGFDHGYRSRLGWGPAAIVDYPHLWRWARGIFAIPGLIHDEDLVALDLVPAADGSYRRVWGDPIPVEGVDDLLAAWRDTVTSEAHAS